MKVGGGFLLDKYVWHRSAGLNRNGPLKFRRAFVFRFINDEAHLDLKNVQNMQAITKIFGFNLQKEFGESFSDLKHGDRIIDSQILQPWKKTG